MFQANYKDTWMILIEAVWSLFCRQFCTNFFYWGIFKSNQSKEFFKNTLPLNGSPVVSWQFNVHEIPPTLCFVQLIPDPYRVIQVNFKRWGKLGNIKWVTPNVFFIYFPYVIQGNLK